MLGSMAFPTTFMVGMFLKAIPTSSIPSREGIFIFSNTNPTTWAATTIAISEKKIPSPGRALLPTTRKTSSQSSGEKVKNITILLNDLFFIRRINCDFNRLQQFLALFVSFSVSCSIFSTFETSLLSNASVISAVFFSSFSDMIFKMVFLLVSLFDFKF